MRLLIVGAGGFLGAHVRRRARAAWTWSPLAVPRCLTRRATGWRTWPPTGPAAIAAMLTNGQALSPAGNRRRNTVTRIPARRKR